MGESDYMSIKALEAYCKAKGYRGGTIFQALEECSLLNPKINRSTDPYKWGVREGMARRHGDFLGNYPVPVNSWVCISEEHRGDCTIEYIAGLNDGLLQGYTFSDGVN
jgi:hypothetical protein